jgi:hypothetical protein
MLKDDEVSLDMAGRVKTVEALIVLMTATNHALDGIVGSRDGVSVDARGECGQRRSRKSNVAAGVDCA